jgi:YD repeat-containing protein
MSFDAQDRLTEVHDPGGLVTTIGYDEVGNVTLIADSAGNRCVFAYDERDSLVRAAWSSGNSAEYEYDERGDLYRATLRSATGSVLAWATYLHDALHRIRRVEQNAPELGHAPFRCLRLATTTSGRVVRTAPPQTHPLSLAESCPIRPPRRCCRLRRSMRRRASTIRVY